MCSKLELVIPRYSPHNSRSGTTVLFLASVELRNAKTNEHIYLVMTWFVCSRELELVCMVQWGGIQHNSFVDLITSIKVKATSLRWPLEDGVV
jgi:hypothetical protein